MKDNIEQITKVMIEIKKLNQLQDNITSVAAQLRERTYSFKNPESLESYELRQKRAIRSHGYLGPYQDRITRSYYDDLIDIISKELVSKFDSLTDLVKRSRVIDHSDRSLNEDTTSSE